MYNSQYRVTRILFNIQNLALWYKTFPVTLYKDVTKLDTLAVCVVNGKIPYKLQNLLLIKILQRVHPVWGHTLSYALYQFCCVLVYKLFAVCFTHISLPLSLKCFNAVFGSEATLPTRHTQSEINGHSLVDCVKCQIFQWTWKFVMSATLFRQSFAFITKIFHTHWKMHWNFVSASNWLHFDRKLTFLSFLRVYWFAIDLELTLFFCLLCFICLDRTKTRRSQSDVYMFCCAVSFTISHTVGLSLMIRRSKKCEEDVKRRLTHLTAGFHSAGRAEKARSEWVVIKEDFHRHPLFARLWIE